MKSSLENREDLEALCGIGNIKEREKAIQIQEKLSKQ